MARAYASTVVNADVATVWETVRDFGAVTRWIPGCKSGEVLTDGDPTRPIRRLVLADGSVVDEVLLALDDVSRRICYGFPAEPPRGMRSFVGTAHVRPVTDCDRTFLEWCSEFDTEQKWEATMIANISGMLAQIVGAVATEVEKDRRDA